MQIINALGDQCPIPVVKTKNAIRALQAPGELAVLVDNEIAVQNLTKLAQQKDYGIQSAKLAENKYQVTLTVNEVGAETAAEPATICVPDARADRLVVISSETMGEGDPVLGKTLLKGFIFALTQQDLLPQTILFYNGGAHLTCVGSASLEDLRSLEAQGVEILTCGTCLNHYQLTEKLAVGGVTNMYVIAEKMLQAASVIKPC